MFPLISVQDLCNVTHASTLDFSHSLPGYTLHKLTYMDLAVKTEWYEYIKKIMEPVEQVAGWRNAYEYNKYILGSKS